MIMGIFALVIISNFLVSADNNRFDLSVLLVALMFAFFVLANVFTARTRLKKQALQFADSADNAAIFAVTDYTFAETGVIVKDNFKLVHFNWNAFIKKTETDKYIYLFITGTGAIIIPLRIFKSAAEKEKLLQLLRLHLSLDAEVGHLVDNKTV
jgi:hypothetical protein